jgi:hypothetical protein
MGFGNKTLMIDTYNELCCQKNSGGFVMMIGGKPQSGWIYLS